MKKVCTVLFVALLLCGINAFASEAYPASPHKMTFNGAEVWSRERFAIDGQTYVNIRDIAHIYDKFVLDGGENELMISDILPAETNDVEECLYFGIPCYNIKDLGDQILDPMAGVRVTAYEQDYPRLIYVTDERWYEIADITCLFFSDKVAWEKNFYSHYYMPREIYEKFHSRLVLPSLNVSGSEVKIICEGREYTLSCITENNEVYSPVRELAEIFGYNVSFENEVVTLTDPSVNTPEKPAGLDLYYIDGVEFLREIDVRPIIEAHGFTGESDFQTYDRQRTAYGYCISGFPPGKTGFVREAVPYVNLASPDDRFDREKAWNAFLMYEYFKKTETFPGLLD